MMPSSIDSTSCAVIHKRRAPTGDPVARDPRRRVRRPAPTRPTQTRIDLPAGDPSTHAVGRIYDLEHHVPARDVARVDRFDHEATQPV